MTVDVLKQYQQAQLQESFTVLQQETFAAACLMIHDAGLKKYLTIGGVSFLHEGLNNNDRQVVIELFDMGLVKFCVMSNYMMWEVSFSAHIVAVMGTEYNDHYNGPSYSISEILKMIGQVGRPSIDRVGKALILCHPYKKRYYDLFLNELLPLESCIQHSLHDTLNSAIVVGTVENIQAGVNYLAKTFMCRRLHKNPGYYKCQGVSNEEVTNNLTSLVVGSINKLIESGMVIAHDHGNRVSPSNLGRISSENYTKCKTIETFSARLTGEADMWEILETLCLASEFDSLPTRRIFIEEEEIRQLITKQMFLYANVRVTDPHVKANALLQAHLSRLSITSVNLMADKRDILVLLDKVLNGLMKVITTRHLTNQLISAIDINHMVDQAIWHNDSVLLQLPHLTRELVAKCNQNNIHNFND